jgi:ribosomal protein S11
MSSSLAPKRTCEAQLSDPLSDAGILELVLNYLDPQVWLYLGAVSNLWKRCYEKVTLAQARHKASMKGGERSLSAPPRETAYSAVFQSVTTLTWAYTSGLQLDSNRSRKLQYAAGRCASLLALEVAHGLGMPMSYKVFAGAVSSGRESVVDHLYTVHRCPMAWEVAFSPARKGNISMLKYLKERGYELHTHLATRAAPAGQLEVMKYLSSEGCSWRHERFVVEYAAQSGNLEMVS